MEISGKGVNDAMAEFEAHWIGREIEGVASAGRGRLLPRPRAGVVQDQRLIDQKVDAALARAGRSKRVEAVLRAILRCGAYELAAAPTCRRKVVITEYVDVAPAFLGGEESAWSTRCSIDRARDARQELGSARLTARRRDPGGTPQRRRSDRPLVPPLAGEGGLRSSTMRPCFTPPPGCDLVVTADASSRGVHFFPDDPADAIAWKALRVNVSDLAAKGAEPLGYVLRLALPPGWTEDWLAGFCEGLRQCSEQNGVS